MDTINSYVLISAAESGSNNGKNFIQNFEFGEKSYLLCSVKGDVQGVILIVLKLKH